MSPWTHHGHGTKTARASDDRAALTERTPADGHDRVMPPSLRQLRGSSPRSCDRCDLAPEPIKR